MDIKGGTEGEVKYKVRTLENRCVYHLPFSLLQCAHPYYWGWAGSNGARDLHPDIRHPHCWSELADLSHDVQRHAVPLGHIR